MKVDLHNHTPLCNHAQGAMQEYIEAALACNTEIFGFSDHAPMDFDPHYRMDFNQMAQYEADIHAMQKRYKGKITILAGYEVDFLEGHIDQRVLRADVDYLIGSVHFIDKWGFDNPEFIGRYDEEDIDTIWIKYFNAVEAMAQTGYFQIVGHFDLIKVFKFMPTKKISTLAHKALVAIQKANMALELNVAGYRKPIKEAYPSRELLQEAFALGIPITFGSDAHQPQQVGLYTQEITTLAKEVGYTECVYFQKKKMYKVAL
jgi:histidinol-phosphatase (PHP family)